MRRYKTSFTFINCESHVYSFQGFGGKRFLLIAQEKSATCKSDFITNPELLIPPILFLLRECSKRVDVIFIYFLVLVFNICSSPRFQILPMLHNQQFLNWSTIACLPNQTKGSLSYKDHFFKVSFDSNTHYPIGRFQLKWSCYAT
jgi:hypothetical protein